MRFIVHIIVSCRYYCRQIESACGVPLQCERYPDDDVSDACHVSPTPPTRDDAVYPDAVACDRDEFLCGNDRCVPETAKCDLIDHCGDYSDEVPCSPSTDVDCTFEDGSAGTQCQYEQDVWNGVNAWRLVEGPSPSVTTGPLYDHTLRRTTGHYMLFEASGILNHQYARLISATVILDVEHCLRFYYFMYGDDVGSLKVLYHFDVTANERLLWQKWRDSGPRWMQGFVTIPTGEAEIVFYASRGSSFRGDIALDDVTLRRGACPELQCGAGEFSCANGHCIADVYRCDSSNDCQDYSDERDCNCTSAQWQCNMGMCISNHLRCDGIEQCPDLSDELDCACPIGRVRCPADDVCIQREWLCDRENDCADGWDENAENCPPCSGSDQFQCQDFGCVSAAQRCDGSRDCADGSDEYACIRSRDTNALEVYNADVWKAVCYDTFPQSLQAAACAELGQGAPETL